MTEGAQSDDYPSQGKTLDALGVPWVWDDDLGPLVASRQDGSGDGAFVYRSTADGLEIIPNPPPWRGAERAKARADRARWATAWIREYSMRSSLDAAERSESSENSGERGSNEEDDDDEDDENGAGDEETTGRRARAHHAQQDHDGSTHTSRSDDASETQLLDTCRIWRVARASTGRLDLTVVTPDGKKFRSKLAAVRHMQKGSR